MKYLLVSKSYEIVWSADLASSIGINGAKTYFQGIKQMSDRTEFDKLWKVMTEKEYNKYSPTESIHPRWWEDIGESSDFDEW